MDETNLQDASPAEGAPVLPEGDAAPAETPAATDETTTTETQSTQPEGEKSRGVQKRLDELTRNWREEQRRNVELMALLRQQGQPAEPAKEPAKVELAAPPVAPTLESSGWDEAKYREDYAKYQTAQAEWMQQAVAARVEQVLTERERKDSERKRTQTFQQREAEFAAKQADYRETVYTADLPITTDMAAIIAESPDGPALAYFLGKNLDKAREIAQLPPVLAARELGRIEARLSAPPAAAPPPAPKKVVSEAPPPPPRIEAAEATAPIRADTADSDKLSDAEWMAMRNKQLSRKRPK